MFPIILPEVPLVANTWTLVVMPDKVRESVKFQLKTLGVLEYSFDAGSNYISTVGSGDQLLGNYSLRSIWFRTTQLDAVKIMVTDKLY